MGTRFKQKSSMKRKTSLGVWGGHHRLKHVGEGGPVVCRHGLQWTENPCVNGSGL